MSQIKIENPETFRSNIVNKLNIKIDNNKNSANLEKGIFNYSLKEAEQRKVLKKWDNNRFVKIYLDRLRTVYLNLNNTIIEQINSGTIKVHKIAFMTHQEMSPERWSKLIEAKIKRDKNKFETNVEAATDTFTCRKCKSNKCTYMQLQLRSADEPMTTFVVCLVCHNTFRFC